MAQKILLRRGGLANVNSGATINVTRGEQIYGSGSLPNTNIGDIVFVANATGNDGFVPVGRLYTGTAAADSFDSRLNGLPYYKTDTKALFRLGSSTALDLSGNLEGSTISSLQASGSFSGSFEGDGSGLSGIGVDGIVAPGSDTQVVFNDGGTLAGSSNVTITATNLDASALNISTTGDISGSNLLLTGDAEVVGNIVLGGNINIGNANTDSITLGGEVTSHIIPDADSTYDLGTTLKRWRNIYVDGLTGSTISIDGAATIGTTLGVTGATTLDSTLNVSGSATFSSTVESTGNFSVNTNKFTVNATTGNTAVAGTLATEGTAQFNGDVDLGNANTDTVTFTARVDSDIVPSVTDTYSLGSESLVWSNGYFTTLTVDSIDIDGTDPTALTWDDVLTNDNATDLDLDLNNNGNQAITHTGTSGNLTISSTNGDVFIEGTQFSGDNVIVAGNLTVEGTTTTIDSTTVDIGDRIISLNAAGTAADGGIEVVDSVSTVGTGSLLWNSTSDYWYAGVSGSTHYRLATYTNASPTSDRIVRVDANKRLVASSLTDDGSAMSSSVDLSMEGNDITNIGSISITGLDASAFVHTDASKVLTTIVPSTAGDLIQWDGSAFQASNVIDGGTF